MTSYKNILLLLIIELIFVSLYKINSQNIFSKDDAENGINFSETIDRIKRKIIKGSTLKWPLPIYYAVGYYVNHLAVEKALQAISKETCITFKKTLSLPKNTSGIIYYNSDHCNSLVGRQNAHSWQVIHIGEACNHPGGIIHETLHALGFLHEQCRYDRDLYLQIRDYNMMEHGIKNCFKVSFINSDTYFLNYDLGSIMHYDSYAYTKNGEKTIATADPHYDKTIGQTERLSFIDIKALNFHYCSDVCEHKIFCYHEGFQNSKICTKCRCPEGFAGPYCEDIAKPRRGCGNSILFVAHRTKRIDFRGRKNCFLHIRTFPGRKIFIKLVSINMYPNDYRICSFRNSLEINYQIDKSISGAKFCHKDGNKLIASYNNHVIIYYRSVNTRNYVKLSLRSIVY
uniref:Metalloendopeptidase n=2 Tax=Strongyloides papillosus TaxID=174720 RepID=A0A0N5BIQ7_STREA